MGRVLDDPPLQDLLFKELTWGFRHIIILSKSFIIITSAPKLAQRGSVNSQGTELHSYKIGFTFHLFGFVAYSRPEFLHRVQQKPMGLCARGCLLAWVVWLLFALALMERGHDLPLTLVFRLALLLGQVSHLGKNGSSR